MVCYVVQGSGSPQGVQRLKAALQDDDFPAALDSLHSHFDTKTGVLSNPSQSVSVVSIHAHAGVLVVVCGCCVRLTGPLLFSKRMFCRP